MRVCRSPLRAKEGVKSLGAGATGSCEPSYMGPGSQILKRCVCSVCKFHKQQDFNVCFRIFGIQILTYFLSGSIVN